MRFGTRNFMRFGPDSQLNFDLYARAFYNTPTIGSRIPKVYLDGVYRPSGFIQYSLKSAWDLQHNMLDHGNVRADITFSENIALGLEYRHRSPYAWRKVDYDNFMVDTFHRQHSLRHSLMSDRRDTFLTHFFLRVMPELAFDVRTRHGWGRRHAKGYNEYEVNCITLLRNTIRLTFTFRHRSTGNDYSIDFAFGDSSPTVDTTFKRISQGNYNLP